MPLRLRVACLCLTTAIVFAAVFAFVTPFEQPQWYHAFADDRTHFGIPNMQNVVSNAPFCIVGIWGLIYMASPASRRPGAFLENRERIPYWVYFAGLFLTGVGSAYYHAHPSNDTLVWDRLPLMITFMGLLTGALAERIDVRLSTWALVPLILLATGSVVQWHFSEQAGAGDMRFYLTVQFYSLAALLALIVFFSSRYTGTQELIAALVAYVIAKFLEDLDKKIYAGAGFVSGHTLKHLVAGVGSWFVLRMLQKRTPSQKIPRAMDWSKQIRCPNDASAIPCVGDCIENDMPVRSYWCCSCMELFSSVGEPGELTATFTMDVDGRWKKWRSIGSDAQVNAAAQAVLRIPCDHLPIAFTGPANG